MRDVCMFYCMEAEKCIDQMTEMSVYSSVFEATQGDPQAVAEEEKNIEMGAKSESFIRKAINALKAIYQKIKTTISNIFAYIGLKKDDKKLYDEFLKKCREDPALANKKVTVKDWKAIQAKFDEVRAEIEKEMKKEKLSEEEAKPRIIKALQEKIESCGSFASKAVIKVAADQLVTRARFDKELAGNLQNFVDNDMFVLNKMEQELGKHEVRKMKRRLKRINNGCTFMNLKAKLFKKELDVKAQAKKEEEALIRSLALSGLNSARKYGDGVKTVVAVGKFGKGVIHDTRKEVKRDVKHLKALQKEKDRMENPQLGDRLKAKHERNKAKRKARREARDERIRQNIGTPKN